MKASGLKQRIRSGQTVIGLGAPISATKEYFERAMDQESYEFVFTDGQHSAVDDSQLVQFCVLADEFDLPVRFRIKHAMHCQLIGNYLDLGAGGIEVPQTETERVNENETLREKVYCPVRAHSMVVGGGLIHTSAGNLGA